MMGENIRFEAGTQKCGICGTKEDIIQFQMDRVVKKLPITEIKFFCKSCAIKSRLIKK